jgi:hypothetical protein
MPPRQLFTSVSTLPSSGSLPGDFNNDGKVDAADYVIWRKQNGTNNALPNDNGLGVPIGQAHHTLWRNNYGRPPGASTEVASGLVSAAVPEPASIVLVFLAALVQILPRRLRRA